MIVCIDTLDSLTNQHDPNFHLSLWKQYGCWELCFLVLCIICNHPLFLFFPFYFEQLLLSGSAVSFVVPTAVNSTKFIVLLLYFYLCRDFSNEICIFCQNVFSFKVFCFMLRRMLNYSAHQNLLSTKLVKLLHLFHGTKL